MRIWDASIGVKIATLNDNSNWVRSVNWSPDRGRLVSGSLSTSSDDKTMCIWDAATRTNIAPRKGNVVSWHPDGNILASGYSNTIYIWNTTEWTVTSTFVDNSNEFFCLSAGAQIVVSSLRATKIIQCASEILGFLLLRGL